MLLSRATIWAPKRSTREDILDELQLDHLCPVRKLTCLGVLFSFLPLFYLQYGWKLSPDLGLS